MQQNVSESLRGLVANWRDQFIRASEANSGRIATLQEQILALGDPPGEGQSDPLAQRRRALNADLAKLQLPVARAQEALSKAQGLVKEIDQLIRAEQKSALFELSKLHRIPFMSFAHVRVPIVFANLKLEALQNPSLFY